MSDATLRLEALGPMTAETEGANPSQEQQQAEQKQATAQDQADQAAREWGILMFTVGGMVSMIDPRLKPVYSEERCHTWGTYASAVAGKYGLNGMSLMPEIALLGCTLSFAVPTVLLLRETVAKLKTAPGQPSGWAAKVGLWWRMRGAKRQAAADGTAANGDAAPPPQQG